MLHYPQDTFLKCYSHCVMAVLAYWVPFFFQPVSSKSSMCEWLWYVYMLLINQSHSFWSRTSYYRLYRPALPHETDEDMWADCIVWWVWPSSPLKQFHSGHYLHVFRTISDMTRCSHKSQRCLASHMGAMFSFGCAVWKEKTPLTIAFSTFICLFLLPSEIIEVV